MNGIYWLILVVIFVAIEMFTVGLVSIWFAGGALMALLASGLGIGQAGQIIIFAAVTALLFAFTKPFAEKYINIKREKTNYEGIIGATVKVTERVDNLNSTGSANYNGQIWTARSKKDEKIFEAGEMATVAEIKGVKLILEESRLEQK